MFLLYFIINSNTYDHYDLSLNMLLLWALILLECATASYLDGQFHRPKKKRVQRLFFICRTRCPAKTYSRIYDFEFTTTLSESWAYALSVGDGKTEKPNDRRAMTRSAGKCERGRMAGAFASFSYVLRPESALLRDCFISFVKRPHNGLGYQRACIEVIEVSTVREANHTILYGVTPVDGRRTLDRHRVSFGFFLSVKPRE